MLDHKIKKQLDKLKIKAEKMANNKGQLEDLLSKAKSKFSENAGKFSGVKNDIKDFMLVISTLIKEGSVNIPWRSLILIIAALIYFLNPFDVLPDFITGLGFVDDLALLNFVVTIVKSDIEKFKNSRDDRQ